MSNRESSSETGGWLRLDIGRVELATGEIRAADGAVRETLAPRPLAVLRYLVAHRDEVITRDALLEGVWGHIEAGTEDSVNVAISSLRKALGDHRRPYRLIQTLPRRGYRYAGPAPGTAGPGAPNRLPEGTPAAGSRRRSGLLAAGAVLLLVGVLASWYLMRGTDGSGRESGASTAASPATAASPRIAVLPFLDLSLTGDQRPFADALVDSILHMLAQVPDLRVVARTSSFAFRDRAFQIPEIAAQLGVKAVLEGSIQRDSDRIRVTAQLVDDAGDHIWSRVYDRRAEDLFDVQDEIAAEVSRALHRTLAPASGEPRNLEAFQQVALGQHAWRLETVAGARQAIGHFERALELAPEHVEAMIGLAEALAQEARLTGRPKDDPSFERYVALIERAYGRAPDDPRAVMVRGDLAFARGNRDAAEDFYRRAAALGPSYAEAYTRLGRTLWRRGAFDEALDRLRIAHDLDPLSDLINAFLADAYWSVGRAEEALARLKENMARNPDFPRYYDRMANYLNQLGRTGEAMRYIQAARDLDPDSAWQAFRVCEYYNQLGDPDAAAACADELAERHGVPDRVLYLRQQIAIVRGDRERARELLHALWRQAPAMELVPSLVALVDASAGACGDALETLEAAHPEFFADPPAPKPIYSSGALVAVDCLREAGRQAQARALLTAVEATLERMRIARGPHYVTGLEETLLLAVQGRHGEAVDAFERLVDGGWRYYWFGLEHYPMLDPIRDELEFRAAVERLAAGVAEQRAWYEEHRDDPLF